MSLEKCPKLYDLCLLKEVSVKQMVEIWSLYKEARTQLWRRSLRHWEKEQENWLEEIIKEVVLNQESDSVHWNLNKGSYRTADGYKVLMQEDSNIQD